ncbi:hypothetical protein STEG23_007342, partial [Scotinomys teguina]
MDQDPQLMVGNLSIIVPPNLLHPPCKTESTFASCTVGLMLHIFHTAALQLFLAPCESERFRSHETTARN